MGERVKRILCHAQDGQRIVLLVFREPGKPIFFGGQGEIIREKHGDHTLRFPVSAIKANLQPTAFLAVRPRQRALPQIEKSGVRQHRISFALVDFILDPR